MSKLREFFGKHTNLLTHSFAGYCVASITTNMMFLQEGYTGWDILLCSVPGIVMAFIAGCVKELVDYEIDWADIFFTAAGGALNAVVILTGLLLHIIN